jgi:hypothetical protein
MAHRFSFFTAGGSAQAKISDTSDLLGILELDQKLWTALAMPVTGVDLDAATLKLLDADGDGAHPGVRHQGRDHVAAGRAQEPGATC